MWNAFQVVYLPKQELSRRRHAWRPGSPPQALHMALRLAQTARTLGSSEVTLDHRRK